MIESESDSRSGKGEGRGLSFARCLSQRQHRADAKDRTSSLKGTAISTHAIVLLHNYLQS